MFGAFQLGTSNPKTTLDSINASVALNPKFARSVAQAFANFGFATRPSALLVAIAHPVKRLDGIELVVDRLEFLAQALDVRIDCAIIDIDLIVIGRIHEIIPALDEAGPLRQRLQDEELRHRQTDRFAVPHAFVT